MAIAIKKILLKKGINAAGKSGLGFIFDGRDNLKKQCKCHISYTDYFDKMFFLQKNVYI